MAYQPDSKTPNKDKILPGYAYATPGPMVVMTGTGGALELYAALEKEGLGDFAIGEAILIYLDKGHYRLNQLVYTDPENDPRAIRLDGPPVTSESPPGSPVFLAWMDQFIAEHAPEEYEKTPPETSEA